MATTIYGYALPFVRNQTTIFDTYGINPLLSILQMNSSNYSLIILTICHYIKKCNAGAKILYSVLRKYKSSLKYLIILTKGDKEYWL